MSTQGFIILKNKQHAIKKSVISGFEVSFTKQIFGPEIKHCFLTLYGADIGIIKLQENLKSKLEYTEYKERIFYKIKEILETDGDTYIDFEDQFWRVSEKENEEIK